MRSIKIGIAVISAMIGCLCGWTPDPAVGQGDRIGELESRLEKEPRNAALLGELGWAYFYRGRDGDAAALERAIDVFERGAVLAPQDRSIQRGLGLACFLKTAFTARSGAGAAEIHAAFDRTLAAFDRALERTPDDSLLVGAHGAALVIAGAVRGRMDAARRGVEQMNRAVNLAPESVHPRLFRGFTHLNLPPALRDSNIAAGDLQTILRKLPPEYNEQAQGSVRVLLGDLYFEMADQPRARAEYQAAAKTKSDAAETARLRLSALAAGGPDAKAVAAYRRNILNCATCHRE
ncbi:MAG: hypothetical protein KF868_14685 [Acidobacteria bacterium]|nr:hypothetical protein [Acidobacteriota bacterium]MCW5970314.1 hypothetical protein [Blastocatellales bacterium]